MGILQGTRWAREPILLDRAGCRGREISVRSGAGLFRTSCPASGNSCPGFRAVARRQTLAPSGRTGLDMAADGRPIGIPCRPRRQQGGGARQLTSPGSLPGHRRTGWQGHVAGDLQEIAGHYEHEPVLGGGIAVWARQIGGDLQTARGPADMKGVEDPHGKGGVSDAEPVREASGGIGGDGGHGSEPIRSAWKGRTGLERRWAPVAFRGRSAALAWLKEASPCRVRARRPGQRYF